MWRIWWRIWWTTLLVANANATTILIQGQQSPVLDYRATLKAHPHFLSPSQDYLANHPSMLARQNLLNLFSVAQRDFLQKSNAESRQRYKEVLGALELDDWSKTDHEIFLHAYLRLAQLETDNAARDRWLLQSLALGEGVGYESSLFPPPLLSRRAELARQTAMKRLSRKLLPAEWAQVLINGQPCLRADCGQWPLHGLVRVTSVSDQWLAQSKTIEVADFANFHPATVAWLEGGCGQNHWNAAAERYREKRAFWSLECDQTLTSDTLNLNPVAALPPLISAVTDKTHVPFYRSTWFWVGAGVVTAALVIGLSAQQKEVREPSTTYGY